MARPDSKERVATLNRMRRINYNLDDRLDNYEENLLSFAQLFRNPSPPTEAQITQALTQLVKDNLDIAQRVGEYDQLEAQRGPDTDGHLTQTQQIIRARGLLVDGLIPKDIPLNTRQRLEAMLRDSLASNKDLTAERARAERSTQKLSSEVSDLSARKGTNEVKNDEIDKDIRKKQAELSGQAARLAQYDRLGAAPETATATAAAALNLEAPALAPGLVQPFIVAAAPVVRAPEPETPAPETRAETPRALSTTESVTVIQEQLKPLNLYDLDVDGRTGRSTREGFSKFMTEYQTLAKLNGQYKGTVDGVYGNGTRTAMASGTPSDIKLPPGMTAERAQKVYAAAAAMRPALDSLESAGKLSVLSMPATLPGTDYTMMALMSDTVHTLDSQGVKTFSDAIHAHARELAGQNGPAYDQAKVDVLVADMAKYYYGSADRAGMAIDYGDLETVPRIAEALYAYHSTAATGKSFEEFINDPSLVRARENIRRTGINVGILMKAMAPLQDGQPHTVEDLARTAAADPHGRDDHRNLGRYMAEIGSKHSFNAAGGRHIDASDRNHVTRAARDLAKRFNLKVTDMDLKAVVDATVQPKPATAPAPAPAVERTGPQERREVGGRGAPPPVVAPTPPQ